MTGTPPKDLPSRGEMLRMYEELLEDYEELLMAVHGAKLRCWGDIHQMTLDKIKELNKDEDR
jgi:hypothetical protein